MRCPIDDTVCESVTLENVQMDICPQCQGVWIGQDQVRKLVRHISMPNLSLIDEMLQEWVANKNEKLTPPKDFWTEDKLICSQDNTQMKKHYFAGSKVGVDQCQKCKRFWLDGGELQAVVQYVKPDHALDQAWQDFIREDNEWRKKMENANAIPAKIVLMLANPKYALIAIGSFIAQVVVDVLRSKEYREYIEKYND